MQENYREDEMNMSLVQFETSNNSNEDLVESTDSFRRRTRDYSRWSPIDEGATLIWNNLSIYTKSQKRGNTPSRRIINNVTGAIMAGNLVALIGSSGAGKSTFMSVLAYRQHADLEIEGDILLNGRPIGPYMKYLSGYMYQEDLFLSYLTVKEHMNILANLKLDRRLSKTDKQKKINDVLRQLGLLKCLNTKIGGGDENKALSGGEKKRLAFASELLTDPQILFCDEPTTGLDSYSAQIIVKIMRKMTFEGKTILCTIHQPSSDLFSMFNQLILLAEGRIAFMGSIDNAVAFFERMGYICPDNYSHCDFFIKILANTPGYEENSKLTVKRFCDEFAVSDYNKEVDIAVQYESYAGKTLLPRYFELRKDFKEPFCYSKFLWLTYRWLLENLRNPSLETLKIVQRIIIAVLVGVCYRNTNYNTQIGIQSVQGLMFIFVSENTFSPMYSVLSQFSENRSIFLREYSSGIYSPCTYYLSKIVSLIPGFIIQPLMFVMVTYFMSNLRLESYTVLMTILITILTMNAASACGIMFANAFESVPTGMAYLVPFDYVLMITSGLFLKLSSLPTLLLWTKYLSWIMYSVEALSIIQWKGIHNITCNNQKTELPCLKDGIEVLGYYNFSENNLTRNIWNMVALIVTFYILGYLFFWWRIKKDTKQ